MKLTKEEIDAERDIAAFVEYGNRVSRSREFSWIRVLFGYVFGCLVFIFFPIIIIAGGYFAKAWNIIITASDARTVVCIVVAIMWFELLRVFFTSSTSGLIWMVTILWFLYPTIIRFIM